MTTVNDLMTKKVISVSPDTSLIEATNLLINNNLSGVPVIDINRNLVGILTEYDLVLKGTYVHLPTFIKLFSEFELYKKDKGLIRDDLKKIFEMKVKEVMNTDPLTLNEGATIEETYRAFSEHHKVNPIPVVDKDHRLVGVVSRFDLNKLLNTIGFIPDLDSGKSRDIDKDINSFLKNFEKRFILVSKTRTHLWLLISVLFAIVGYVIAWALILRLD